MGDWGRGRDGLSQRGVDILQYSGLSIANFIGRKGKNCSLTVVKASFQWCNFGRYILTTI